MAVFTVTLQSPHSGHTALDVKSWLVNVMEPLRQSQGPHACVLPFGDGGSITGDADLRAFAFQGRCFDPVQRNEYSASHGTPADDGVRDQVARDRRASAILAEGALSWSSSRWVKAQSTARSANPLTQQVGAECRRRTSKSDALYSRARRANFQTVSQEQSCKVIVGLALRNRGALEIMKSDAMRAVVLPGWPNGEHHPMGPCFAPWIEL
jgi:hypothetical protein